jgi:hypothetical protein
MPVSCCDLVIGAGRFCGSSWFEVLALPAEEFQFAPVFQFGSEKLLGHLG